MKYKVLLLSDHPLSSSGVGSQARWLTTGLIAKGKYTFRCFGGALKHEDYRLNATVPDLVIKPTNGFGDRNMLRQALAQERPDVLMLFTDPRFFIFVWEMRDEIQQICPIAYNHLWDNPPWPEFNRVLYESTDLINCINYPTYEMVSQRFPDRTNYIPHAVPADLYKPLSEQEKKQNRIKAFGSNAADNFTFLFVSRNAKRKCPSDVIVAFKMFLGELEKKHGHRNARLLMHTNPLDQEGPNLHHVIDMFHLKDHVIFSNETLDFVQMNSLYNIADVLVNVSSNEGFGLSALEAKMAGVPLICQMTGGLTRQVKDHETGVEFGVALEPDVRTLVGNQLVPYIYEDFVSHKKLSDAMMKMFETPKKERDAIGLAAREHALKHYSMENLIEKWDVSLSTLIETWKSNKPKTWSNIEL